MLDCSMAKAVWVSSSILYVVVHQHQKIKYSFLVSGHKSDAQNAAATACLLACCMTSIVNCLIMPRKSIHQSMKSRTPIIISLFSLITMFYRQSLGRSTRTLPAHSPSSNRTPRHRDQDTTLHRLNQRDRLMDRLAPSPDAPALLSTDLALLQIRKLPQVVHGIQLADLDEPGADAFHDLPPRFEASAPVGFPFEQVSWVQGVGAQLEDAAELAGGRGGPEGEFLH
jgi:hypothetical protein